MANTIKLLDVVALTVDLPEYSLWREQVGTVVEILAGGTAFEVEFSDRDGRVTRAPTRAAHGVALRTSSNAATV